MDLRPSVNFMNTSRSTPVDLVVIGAGMAGILAALAAKTPENTVWLIEPSNVLGGQGTAGGVAGFCGDTALVNAPFADLIARLEAHRKIGPLPVTSDRRDYDLEWCAFFLQEMVREKGIRVLLHARVIGAEATDGRVTGLTMATAGEVLRVTPGFVIDASGACIVPHLTGFPVVHEGANKQLPMSLYFTMWKSEEPVTPLLPAGCPRWENDDEIPMTSLHFFPSGKVEVKMKVVGFDAADGLSLSEAEMFARREMYGLIYYLQTHGYRGVLLDRHVLASVSRMIGVREERRIVGEHVLTEAEVRSAAIFPDAVAVNTYHLDFHWPDRAQRAGTGIVDMVEPCHLPLRMFIPRGAKNLLVPGRGASSDQMAMSAFRVMAVVAQMGFAAGHAARQCLATGTDLTTIDIPELQRSITAGGQSLDLSDYGRYLRRDIFAHAEFYRNAPDFTSGGPAAIMQLSNSRFLAAWSGQRGTETGIWWAERRGISWSDPRLLADSFQAARIVIERDGATVTLRAAAANGPGAAWTAPEDLLTWQPAGEGAAPEPLRLCSAPPALAAGTEPVAISIDDGYLAAVYRDDTQGLTAALSTDGGATWPHAWTLVGADNNPTHPAACATRVGLGVFYLADGTRPAFWLGSVERIIDGPRYQKSAPQA